MTTVRPAARAFAAASIALAPYFTGRPRPLFPRRTPPSGGFLNNPFAYFRLKPVAAQYALNINVFSRLDAFLRDHRTGDEHPIDPALYDILNDLRLATGTRSPFHVISAYRSPRTNSMLQENGRGVAKGSLHLQGRAIDVRLADVGSASLRDAAVELQRGGVGYYRGPDFVHVDTGRVRRW